MGYSHIYIFFMDKYPCYPIFNHSSPSQLNLSHPGRVFFGRCGGKLLKRQPDGRHLCSQRCYIYIYICVQWHNDFKCVEWLHELYVYI